MGWRDGGFDGASPGGRLCRIGWHALGNWHLRCIFTGFGGGIVGLIYAFERRPNSPYLSADRVFAGAIGSARLRRMGTTGRLDGLVVRLAAIAAGLRRFRLAAQLGQLPGTNGFYARRCIADFVVTGTQIAGVERACDVYSCTERDERFRCLFRSMQPGAVAADEALEAGFSSHHRGGWAQCHRELPAALPYHRRAHCGGTARRFACFGLAGPVTLE